MSQLPDSLVISGASSAGIKFLGKLFQMEKDGQIILCNLKVAAGVSIGALISLFLANNLSPLEIMNSLVRHKCYEIFSRKNPLLEMVSGKGVYSLSELKKGVANMLGPENAEKCFDELPINFLCAAYNMDTQEYQIFSSKHTPKMKAIDAAILSCAIPFLFEPAMYDGCRYVDGGVVHNFPLTAVLETFSPQSTLGLLCKKNYAHEERSSKRWSIKDFLPLVMAATNYHTSLAVKDLPPNTRVVTISSNLPFYRLSLSETAIWQLFFDGMSE